MQKRISKNEFEQQTGASLRPIPRHFVKVALNNSRRKNTCEAHDIQIKS